MAQRSLIDEGLINFVPWPESAIRVESVSRRIMTGMLASEGFAALAEDPVCALEDFNSAVLSIKDFESRTGKKLPRFGPSSGSENLAKQALRDLLQKEDYTAEEHKEAAAIRKQHKENVPMRDAIREYELLDTVATEQNAQLRTPLLPNAINMSVTGILSPQVGLPASIKLFRIAATSLGKLPFRNTLKETLKLSRDPATIALRQQIDQWLSAWSNNDEQDIQVIEREIQKASEALSKIGPFKVVSAFCAWVAVAVGVAEAFNNLPPHLSASIAAFGEAAEVRKLVVDGRWIQNPSAESTYMRYRDCAETES